MDDKEVLEEQRHADILADAIDWLLASASRHRDRGRVFLADKLLEVRADLELELSLVSDRKRSRTMIRGKG